MRIADYIEQTLDSQGRTKTWLADQLELERQLLNYRFKNDSFSAKELIKTSCLLGINLEDLKNKCKGNII